ncbi:MAG: cell division protein FtsH, partial [Acidobacteria bacterium]|nr:cell division protein FtsH [Acidobacteriota bacterium]
VRIAEALLERETIDSEEVKMLVEDRPLPPMKKAAVLKNAAPPAPAKPAEPEAGAAGPSPVMGGPHPQPTS